MKETIQFTDNTLNANDIEIIIKSIKKFSVAPADIVEYLYLEHKIKDNNKLDQLANQIYINL